MKKSLTLMIVLGALLVGILFTLDNKGKSDSKLFNAGTHSGTAFGFGGVLEVAVTTSEDKIEDISIVSHNDTPAIAEPAFESIIADIIKYQSIAVDTVAGATDSSRATREAVWSALESAGATLERVSTPIVKSEVAQEVEESVETGTVATEKKDGALFIPGKFTGEDTGYGGLITIEVTTSDDKIENIAVVSHSETGSIFTPAFESLSSEIVANQSIAVDTVAGATLSSNGIIGAVTSALLTAGATLEDISASTGTGDSAAGTFENATTDIVVVGGGGAGLTAAIAAKEKGVNVILLEKMAMLGGNTTYSTAGMNAANTKLQEQQGIEDTEQLFYDDTMKSGQNRSNPELLKVFTDSAKDMVDWLVERGMDLSEMSTSGGSSVSRVHRPTGGAAVGPVLVETLSKKAESLGVEIRTNSKVTGFIREGDKVVGVEVESNGQTYQVSSKAVIMATGGFGANADMISKFNPSLTGFGSTNSPGITGEGIEMIENIGGVLVDMELIQTHPTVVHEKSDMITESVRGEGAILVNREGKRFISELETRDNVSAAILGSTGGSAFLVFDQTVRENLGAINTYVNRGFTKQGDTWEELAKEIGADEEALSASIVTYNEFVKNGEDTEFGNRTLKLELVNAPFYAIEISPAIHHTMGGVQINTNTEVININGAIIEGLYAAGEITGGIHGANRIGGNAVADIVVFGKIAGDNASDYAIANTEAVATEKKDGALFIPGKFTGEDIGYGGAISVEVTTTDDKIESIAVVSTSDTDSIFTSAFESITAEIITHQSIAVDTVAGATLSSNGIIGAVTSALVSAGATLEDISTPIAKDTAAVTVEDATTDIVIVGGGGAGLTAAIAAREKGANVILLEKMAMLGGNTTYSTGGMNAANTKLQAKEGIEDSEQLFFDDTMRGGQNRNNPELLKVMTDNAKFMVDWLVERGMDLSEMSTSGGSSVSRVHRPTGGKAVGPVLVEALSKKAESLGVDIRTNSRLTAIIKEGDKVVGVEVEVNGQTYKIHSKAVIMATGGFGANPQMIAEANPAYSGFGTTNSPGITGEGIKMIESIGGDLVDMELIQTHPTVVHEQPDMITESVRGEGAILINREGKRFINELETRDTVSKAVLESTGASAFLVFDQTVRDNLGVINTYVSRGFAVQADTLEELAGQFGADATTLVDSVSTYNEFVRNKVDTAFGNTTLKVELIKAPFYAIEISPAIHHTMGGVRINTNTEVIDTNGNVIEGLFAAGEVTGGIHGANRIGGNAVADIIVFGKIAGDNASEYVKGQ